LVALASQSITLALTLIIDLDLRKEKEKALKDASNLDAKFKQAVKERSVLQGEKVTLEREIKRLLSHNTGLEKQMEKVKTKENKIKEERDQRLQVEKQLTTLTKAYEKLQVCVTNHLCQFLNLVFTRLLFFSLSSPKRKRR
jgi:chromosome segregation ATPase